MPGEALVFGRKCLDLGVLLSGSKSFGFDFELDFDFNFDCDSNVIQGCLSPVTFIIPPRSILSPTGDAAVVGGNVLTSQRLCDVVLQAFEACACSQGCMNNFLFGDSSFGYYETIAGGSGAGPSFDGTSGVHTHMTNTRITDPEILERRCEEGFVSVLSMVRFFVVIVTRALL